TSENTARQHEEARAQQGADGCARSQFNSCRSATASQRSHPRASGDLFRKVFLNEGSQPLLGGTGAQGSGPGELVLERFGDVDRQLRRVRESHHASRGGSWFVRYCDSQNHAAQLQSYIHRERDRTASDAGVGGHGSTLRVHHGSMINPSRLGRPVNCFTFSREIFRAKLAPPKKSPRRRSGWPRAKWVAWGKSRAVATLP